MQEEGNVEENQRIKSARFPQMKYPHELVIEDMPKRGTGNIT